MNVTNKEAKNFWKKAQHGEGPQDCIIWIGARSGGGYGAIKFRSEMIGAHRMAYLLERGDIPEGYVIHHKCHVRECVHPAHLEAVTVADNNKERMRQKKEECKNGHPMTEENTYTYPNGRAKQCRVCMRETNRRSRANYRTRRGW